MAISNNDSYISTMNEFIAHWGECNAAIAPSSLVVRLPDNTTRSLLQFTAMRNTLLLNQNLVQATLTAQQIARAGIALEKTGLLAQINLFNAELDASYQNTDYFAARPYVPAFTAGQEAFTRPMNDAMNLWGDLNDGTAPEGVTLPLVLADGTTVTSFTAAIASLTAAYLEEQVKGMKVTLARAKRNRTQQVSYATMKAYREKVPAALVAYPELIETMPRLTPLPGHTPAAVNASAIFIAPNSAKVVYDASNDPTLARYELRGTVGDHYDEQDAVVIATNQPGDTREFVTSFGLNQPGAEIALKVFVVLTTGNEAGSAPMLVDRPATIQLLAA
jgi:hypothetical protein